MRVLRVCLIGVGSIGGLHLEAYRQDTSVTVDVVELDPKKQQQLVNDGFHVVPDIDAAARGKYDLYDICLPTFSHATAIETLLERTTAPILCEKPLTLRAKELERIISIPDADTRLFCAYVERFNEPFVALKDWAHTQTAPFMIDISRRTKNPRNAPWFNKPELGGDILLDLGVHDIDLALWYTDSRVTGLSNHIFADNDHESVALHFANGSTAQMYLGWDLPEDHPIGIENRITIRSSTGDTLSYDSDTEELSGSINRRVRPRFPQAYYDEIAEALRIARSGKSTIFPCLISVKQALETIEMITEQRKDTL